MNTSEKIRSLAASGVPVAEISRRLGVRYQHAYKVCRDAGMVSTSPARDSSATPPLPARKPKLTVSLLAEGGFAAAGRWIAGETRLSCSAELPCEGGVYAFSIGEDVVYVGLASRSLSQRLYLYGNPGASQRTNTRLNALIRDALASGRSVDVHFACPPSLEWNGFRISGPEGLEAGLIGDYHLSWNVRGA
jgi:hypothetical protein